MFRGSEAGVTDDQEKEVSRPPEPPTCGAPATPPVNRDWFAELNAIRVRDDAERRHAIDDAVAASQPVTLSASRLSNVDEGGILPVVDIMLGAARIGMLILEDWGETLWIGKIGIDADLQCRGYGERAIALLAALAAKEKYRMLAGKIALGPADVMERRKRFCRKCGFAVGADDRVELHLDVPRRIFPRLPIPSGNWNTPAWFTEPQHTDALWGMRYEAAELPSARHALERAYPGPFCRDYLDAAARAREPASSDDAAIRKFRQRIALADEISGLFEPHGPVSLILALGVDLALVTEEKPPGRWLERFRNPADVAGAQFETEVWANALRASIQIARVPEKTGRNKRIKTPDFAVEWDGLRVGIEAKALSTGEHDMVRHDHLLLIHPNPPDDREYHVEVAGEIQALAARPEGRERYREIFPGVEEALAAKRWELEQAGSPLGEHQVPGAGRITIARRDPESPGRSATISSASEATQEEKARRLLPHLQDAAEKFRLWPDRDSRAAVAIIDAPSDHNPDAVIRALAAELRRDVRLYRAIDAVVWRRRAWHIDEGSDPWKTYQHFACFVMRLPWSPIPVERLADLCRLLLASPHRLLAPPRLRDRPDLVPSVAESMLVGMSEVEVPEMGTAT